MRPHAHVTSARTPPHAHTHALTRGRSGHISRCVSSSRGCCSCRQWALRTRRCQRTSRPAQWDSPGERGLETPPDETDTTTAGTSEAQTRTLGFASRDHDRVSCDKSHLRNNFADDKAWGAGGGKVPQTKSAFEHFLSSAPSLNCNTACIRRNSTLTKNVGKHTLLLWFSSTRGATTILARAFPRRLTQGLSGKQNNQGYLFSPFEELEFRFWKR